jgi:YegS/Rv2252/BmrU family lipid kinase
MHIAIVVNPKAGKGKSLKMMEQLQLLLQQHSVNYQSFTDVWPATFEGFTDVWIIGGDGTLNYFINHYPNIQLPLALFKGGTGNDFAWKLYGDSNLKQQFEIVMSSAPQPVDAARCNEFLFLNGVGIGFDGVVLKQMKAIRLIGGHFGYYLAVLKSIFSFRESCFEINSNSLHFKGKLLLAMVNNSSRTGGGFHVSPKASVNDGLIDLVTATPLSILKRFYYLPKIEKGNHLELPFVQHHIGEYFSVECDKELPAQLDGELIVDKQFKFSVLMNHFLFRYQPL